MPVTLDCTLRVPLRSLKQAITAVLPHCEPSKTGDEITSLSRLRLIAAKTELLVAATCTHTTALAAVGIAEDSRTERFAADDGVFNVDLLPKFGRLLVSNFSASRSLQDGVDELAELEFSAESALMRVTDVGGMFPGLSNTYPTLQLAADYPDVVGIMSKVVANAAGDPKPLVAKGSMLALFNQASTAYNQPLQFVASGTAESRGYAVYCGSAFVGAISSGHADDDSLSKRESERRLIRERLGLAPALQAVGA